MRAMKSLTSIRTNWRTNVGRQRRGASLERADASAVMSLLAWLRAHGATIDVERVMFGYSKRYGFAGVAIESHEEGDVRGGERAMGRAFD